MTETNQELAITLTGKNTIAIMNQLCAITGMTPPCLVALMIRKYGKELALWVDESSEALPITHLTEHPPKPTIELPTDPGENLPPVEL